VVCLEAADNVVVLSNDGRVEAQGSFQALFGSNQFLQGLASRNSSDNSEEREAEQEDPITNNDGAPSPRAVEEQSNKAKTSRGNGDFPLYSYYIQSFGWWPFGFVLASAALFVLCLVFPR
jgi:ATP-binding cassette, subfamily C (CFTR/MRP), member 1